MDYDKKYNEKIYPELPVTEPSAPPEPETGSNYRIGKINEIQQALEKERDQRRDLSKKYNRGIKLINYTDGFLITVCMGLGSAGVFLFSTVILAPVVAAMEGVALGSGLLSIVGKYVNTRLTLKAQKILAEAKLNTISDHISKALNDGEISAEEFALIMSELSKFQEMKNAIRKKNKERNSEEDKNSLIEQGRKEARESFVNQFFKKSATSNVK